MKRIQDASMSFVSGRDIAIIYEAFDFKTSLFRKDLVLGVVASVSRPLNAP